MSDDILEAAARWHAAQDGDDMDWTGFTAWLEADPRHRVAFDHIALLDDDVALLRMNEAEYSARQAPRSSLARRRRSAPAPWMVFGATAACAALTVGVLTIGRRAPPPSDAIWFAGLTPRTIVIADRSSAVLSPGSSLRRSGAHGNLQLTGRAFFSIRHDPARKMVIDAGAYRVRDVGTRFDLVEADGSLDLQVVEGGVEVGTTGADGSIRVNAGHELIVNRPGATAELRTSAASTAGGWRGGAFRYDDVPLAIVAADVSRYSGRRIVLGADAAGRRFSGVIVRGDRDAMIRTLGNLTGLNAKNEGDRVRLGAGD